MILPENKTLIVERGNKKVYDLGDQIVKVFNDTKPVSDVFNEALNLARINETGIASPKPIEVSEVEGEGFAIKTTKIPGVTMAQKMEEEPARFYEYLEQFVDLQIYIHSFRKRSLNRMKDKYIRMINHVDLLNASQRYSLLERVNGMKREVQVCHGDFNPTNVIMCDDGTLAVCDWAHATQGSPAADAAMTYLLFAMQDKQQADTYLELYCDKADEPVQVVRQWMSVVAATELDRKRSTDDKEFLMSWVDVFDYQ